MPYVTIVFKVEEQHNITEREKELLSEIKRMQDSSQLGLEYVSYEVTQLDPSFVRS